MTMLQLSKYWRWILLFLFLLFYVLSSDLFPDLPLREGYIALCRIMAAGLIFVVIGGHFLRTAYLNTKNTANKTGCVMSLLKWGFPLKVLGLGVCLFMFFGMGLFGEDTVDLIEYRIQGKKLIDVCQNQDYYPNKSTLERIKSEQPTALRIKYWAQNMIKSVQFLSREDVGQTKPCSSQYAKVNEARHNTSSID